jgi:hypothetical protein
LFPLNLPSSATELALQAQALIADQETWPLLGLLGVAAVLKALPSRRQEKAQQPRAARSKTLKRPDNTPWLNRQWWKVRRPYDMMQVDGLVLDRSRQPHCLWIGPTGSGKSAAVATVRCDHKRPMLIVTPDLSDPLREQADFIWTAGVSETPIDLLIGSADDVAERLTEVFRSGGYGVWKGAARRATADVIHALDLAGESRSLEAIGQGLKAATANDRELRQMVANWIARYLDVADKLGSSVADGGLDIADLLNRGLTVVLDNDAMLHRGLVGDVVAWGLAEAQRCSDLVPGGFRLVFEEAAQVGERIDLAEPFFRAGRRRRITVDAISQSESDFDKAPGISDNAATRVYFRPHTASLRTKAADHLDLDEGELATMQRFTAWLDHDGALRRLVKFPKPRNGYVTREVIHTGETRGRQVGGDLQASKGTKPIASIVAPRALPALPPPSIEFQSYLKNVYRERGCLRWHGKHDPKGYGYIYLQSEEKSVLVHRWRFEQAYGAIGRDPVTGKKMTLGHRDSCYRDCSDLTHLKPQTRGDNSRDRWAAERNGVKHE